MHVCFKNTERFAQGDEERRTGLNNTGSCIVMGVECVVKHVLLCFDGSIGLCTGCGLLLSQANLHTLVLELSLLRVWLWAM